MPKPSFMQTVLRKPTRSYADPYAPSPWADYDDDRSSVGGYGQYPASKYSRQMDNGVHLGFKQGYLNDAGPSSEAYATRRAKNTTTTSTVSDSQRAMGTRFPKPVKKAQSTISLRETGRNVVVDEYSLEEPTRSGTVRRKKKAIGQGSDAGSSTNSRSSSPVPPPARSTTKKRTKMQQVIRHDDEHSSVVSSQSSLPDYARPPPLHARGDSQTSSSIASLPRNSQTNAKATASRPAVAAIQKHFPPGVTSPPTPPLSDRDSTESALTHERQKTSTVRPSPQRQPSIPEVKEAVPPVPARNPKRVSISSVQASDDGEETFHTPQPSPSTPSHARESVVPRVAALAVPQFSVQPPTPDAINEPAETPFHSASTTSATSPAGPSSPLAAKDVANPLAANGTNPAPGISAQMIKLALEEEVRQTAEPVEMDAESDHGEAGSDPDDSSPTDERLSAAAAVAARRGSRQHSRQSSLAGDRPRSKLGSRPPSVIMSAGSEYDGRRPVSRQSTTRSSSRNNFDDFVVRRHSPPESVYSAAPPGSVSGISGYGKGGWAAAHSARSGSSTPVMYMPAGGSTGWEEFQRPPSQQQRFPPLHPSSLAATAPPRQSKFTPLPLAAQPHTFNRIVHGVQGEDRSVPSSYSQGSDDESDEEYAQLPKASRSYKRTSPENGSERYESELGDRYPDNRSQVSMTRSEARFEETLRQRQMVLGAPVSPYNDTTSPVPGPKSPRRFSGAASMGDLRANGGRYPALPVPVMPRALTTSFDQYESQGGYEQSHASVPISPTSRSRPASRMDYDRDASRPTSPAMSMASRPASRMGFDPPSFLNPDTLTVLPEMSLEDSARTYMPPDPTEPSESGRSRRRSSTRRSHSVLGAFRKGTSSRGGRSRAGSDDEDEEDERDQVGELKVRRAKSSIGFRDPGSTSLWESSSVGDGVLMESNGRGAESVSGYTNLILPAGAYKSSNPAKSAAEINSRILGMPHASMAAIVFSTVANRDTPAHLRDQSPPVDFSSHLKPPGKVGNGQLLVQVYATAIDEIDVRALDQKGRGDIGKWVPGRSFVGRCMATGPEEKDLVRGDIVMGIMDVKKSGTLAEYILCDRRRIARAPHPTTLSLEQMALLPVQGIAAARAVRLYLGRGKRALIMNPFQGVPALVCQELSRSGVNVTAIISGGDDHHDPQVECYNNGARGVLIGSPAAVMMGVDESGWDYVLVTEKNSRIYDAATRILKDGGKIVSLVQPESALPASIAVQQRTSGFKTLKMAFKSKKKDAKHVNFEYIPPTGSGEPAVDSSGVDYRDVMEEECMNHFRPVLDHPAIFFEKARDAFVGGGREGSKVVRIVN